MASAGTSGEAEGATCFDLEGRPRPRPLGVEAGLDGAALDLTGDEAVEAGVFLPLPLPRPVGVEAEPVEGVDTFLPALAGVDDLEEEEAPF